MFLVVSSCHTANHSDGGASTWQAPIKVAQGGSAAASCCRLPASCSAAEGLSHSTAVEQKLGRGVRSASASERGSMPALRTMLRRCGCSASRLRWAGDSGVGGRACV